MAKAVRRQMEFAVLATSPNYESEARVSSVSMFQQRETATIEPRRSSESEMDYSSAHASRDQSDRTLQNVCTLILSMRFSPAQNLDS